MAGYSPGPYGNATSFSGIPWTVNNPNYNPNPYGFAGDLAGSFGGAHNATYGGGPTMQNPQATGYGNQIEGIAGQLAGSGAGAVSSAKGTQQTVSGMADQMRALGTGLSTAFSGNLGYADQALQTAFDPQKTAYDYYLNQNMNQTAAGEAQSGLAGTPYAAEVGAAATGAFQNAWQTSQVGREATGAATATGLQNQYEQGVLGGAGLINQAGQLDLGAMSGVLQAYGLQGQNLASAGQMIQGLLSSLGISETGAYGNPLTGTPNSYSNASGA
jgi:hypothetical protein